MYQITENRVSELLVFKISRGLVPQIPSLDSSRLRRETHSKVNTDIKKKFYYIELNICINWSYFQFTDCHSSKYVLKNRH